MPHIGHLGQTEVCSVCKAPSLSSTLEEVSQEGELLEGRWQGGEMPSKEGKKKGILPAPSPACLGWWQLLSLSPLAHREGMEKVLGGP